MYKPKKYKNMIIVFPQYILLDYVFSYFRLKIRRIVIQVILNLGCNFEINLY